MMSSRTSKADQSASDPRMSNQELQQKSAAVLPTLRKAGLLQRTIGNRAMGTLLQRQFQPNTAREKPNRPVIQRYFVIDSGAEEYPAKKEYRKYLKNKDAANDDQFFISQVEQDDSFYSAEKGKDNKYGPNLVYKSNANLAVSDNLDLAIEETDGEPKVFFATKDRIQEANDVLKGSVELVLTNKILQIASSGGTKTLFQVIPSVPDKKEKGLDVKTPQRCNEAAQFVTGAVGLEMKGNQKVYQLLTELLTRVTGRDFVAEYKDAYEKAVNNRDTADLLAVMDDLSTEFRRVRNDEETIAIMKELNMNEYMIPKIGDAITTFGIATRTEESAADKNEIFMYHFASVVARSGPDYITMENYARRDEKSKGTLSGGDPLYFFKMHGTADSAKSWHNHMVGTGNFIGAVVSFVVN
ncbi:hypothetical protein FE783_11355 [Paenibacillus mesophilus]|uniref:hypothetical protein n=1 Tax=Paenibacillus mesophilus TaxID=2582849 RepID=UPI00110E24C5|nr:hypothetical protein [Paenibacillus mesophilus]TMV50154.1 hypothetical protein FE783_11355 [Paenibacillus mesophilus]